MALKFFEFCDGCGPNHHPRQNGRSANPGFSCSHASAYSMTPANRFDEDGIVFRAPAIHCFRGTGLRYCFDRGTDRRTRASLDAGSSGAGRASGGRIPALHRKHRASNRQLPSPKPPDVSVSWWKNGEKHSYYRLANDSVATALESLAALCSAREQSAHDRLKSERVRQLRFARSCYKHLAGRVGVEILQALLHRGFVTLDIERTYRLSRSGQIWWREFGMADPKDISSRACIDWTERRHHLGGALGTALFSRMKEIRWIVPNPGGRSVHVTHLGIRELERQLGISSLLTLRSRSHHHRRDLRKNHTDAVRHAGHNCARGHGDETSHQSIFDKVLTFQVPD